MVGKDLVMEERGMEMQSQEEYAAYHSPAARAARLKAAQSIAEHAVAEAHRLFFDDDVEGARECLFSVGLSDEGVAYYLREWGEF
jgi:hypothetical protein